MQSIGPNDTLSINLAGAPATSNPSFWGSYMVTSSAAVTDDQPIQPTVLEGATPVTILHSGLSSGQTLHLVSFSMTNTDTAPIIASVSFNGTPGIIFTMQPGDVLQFGKNTDAWTVLTSSGGNKQALAANWGQLGGTLSAQTDLQAALDLKANAVSLGTAATHAATDFDQAGAAAAVTKTTLAIQNVTNDAQTKAAVVPNTAPTAGQVLVGNAGGTAYAPVAISGAITIASTGVATAALATTVAPGATPNWPPRPEQVGAGVLATVNTTLAAASGLATLATIPIAANTITTLLVRWHAYTYAEMLAGDQSARVVRIGSNAPTLKAGALSSDYFEDDVAWSPTLVISGNNLLVNLTADAYFDANVKITVSTVEASDISDAVPASQLAALRAAVLKDSPTFAFYADVGLTPPAPNAGDAVTAWADQSGNAHSCGPAVASSPQYGVDAGGKPYLHFTTALGSCYSVGTVPTTSTNHTFRWTCAVDSAAPAATPGLVFEPGSSFWVAIQGDAYKVELYSGSGPTYLTAGAAPTGKHDFELRLAAGSPGTATLFIDGVQVGTGTYTNSQSTNIMRLGALSNGVSSLYFANMKLYGASYVPAIQDAAAMQRWINMSQVAWGAHD